jgi:hypothetical protein
MSESPELLRVDDVARRLHRTTDQVRRYLREGKIRGRRIGGRWFVDPGDLGPELEENRWLVPRDLLEPIRLSSNKIFKRNGIVFDVVAEFRADRESH